jgi:hypothetical protein
VPVPTLARWLLGLGIVATLAANVAHGLGHGLIGAAVAAWPAAALVGSYELLMMIIRGAQTPAAAPGLLDGASVTDPLRERAAVMFAASTRLDAPPRTSRTRAHYVSMVWESPDYSTTTTVVAPGRYERPPAFRTQTGHRP